MAVPFVANQEATTSKGRQSIGSTSYLSLIVATSVVFRNHASCMVLLRPELTQRSAYLQDVLSNRSSFILPKLSLTLYLLNVVYVAYRIVLFFKAYL